MSQITRGPPVRTWSVVDDVLDQRKELAPIPWLTSSHIMKQKSKNLLSLLMDTLVGTELTQPHGGAELVPHPHQRSVFLHQKVPKLSAPVCTEQHRQRSSPCVKLFNGSSSNE